MKIYIKSNRYVYNGSIADRFNNIVIRDTVLHTSASTKGKAQANILSQAKKMLHLSQGAYLKLLKDVEEIPETITNKRGKCEKCGWPLSDGGYCPRCYAYGDETNYL